jgi:hypothetical protein
MLLSLAKVIDAACRRCTMAFIVLSIKHLE